MDAWGEIPWRGPLLWLLAIGFAGFGAAYAGRPSDMATLTGIVLPDGSATIDFAATYGGFQLGLAAFLALCAVREPWIRAGLTAGGLALAGIAVVRLAGTDPGPRKRGADALFRAWAGAAGCGSRAARGPALSEVLRRTLAQPCVSPS